MARPLHHDFSESLRPYGARPKDIVVLAQADPEQRIRYLDLIKNAEKDREAPWPRAVVEVEGQPVLYVVDTPTCARYNDQQVAHLRRILAFRAGADHVALLEPGRLTLYPVEPKKELPQPQPVDRNAAEALALIPSLAFPASERASRERSPRHSSTSTAVHKLLYDLLTSTTDELNNAGIDDLVALSLVGRALFVRFLVDRGVLPDSEVRGICGVTSEECFAHPTRAARMSQWLDDTFNGDFLPLPNQGSKAWFKTLRKEVFNKLTNILQRATPSGQLHLKWGDKWNDLLFDHIPVGLLSQVYEQHAHRFDAVKAKATSVHYTPRQVAEYMIDEVFFGLGSAAPNVHVLDPAVGGGVFLVAAFRRIVAERWKVDRRPPNTRALREILYGQLRGFDISEPALRLCSLALYLTAIELDPDPRPLGRLRFDHSLLGTVLHDVRAKEQRHTYIGSLGSKTAGVQHRGKYDIVIGNPPWTSWKATRNVTNRDIDAQVAQVEASVRDIIRERLGNIAAKRYQMLDKNPDVPFFWRAMEWAKPKGWIALAMHGRLLFKQTDAGRQARNDLFSAVQITGILNGTAVRDTDFWPNVRAPFCLMFARNTGPSVDSAFYFVSPEMERALNGRSRLRIDPASAQPVAVSELRECPTLLKTLFRGTTLDATVMAQIARFKSLGEHLAHYGLQDHKGKGFQVGGVAGKPKPARLLWKMPTLTKQHAASYLIDATQLPLMPRGTQLLSPRKRSIYTAPLVLVSETPPKDHLSRGAFLAFDDIAYNESFIGVSCHHHPDGALLARYLFLLFNSRLPLYIALLTSARFGIERDTFYVEDIERLPFRPLNDLSQVVKREIVGLSDFLIAEGDVALREVEAWVASTIYGLGKYDREVIHDALQVGLPFAANRKAAERGPTPAEAEKYAQRMRSVIQPFLARHGRRVNVRVIPNRSEDPWLIVQVDSNKGDTESTQFDRGALRAIIDEADSLAASQVIVTHPPATLLVATAAQYRYFTPSRARLTALGLIHEHAQTLLGEGGANDS